MTLTPGAGEGETNTDATYGIIINQPQNEPVLASASTPLTPQKEAKKCCILMKPKETLTSFPHIIGSICYMAVMLLFMEIIATYLANSLNEGDYYIQVSDNLAYEVILAIGWNEIDILSISSDDDNSDEINDKVYKYKNECKQDNNSNHCYYCINVDWCQLETKGYIWLAGSIIRCVIILYIGYLFHLIRNKINEEKLHNNNSLELLNNINELERNNNNDRNDTGCKCTCCRRKTAGDLARIKARKDYKKWVYKINKCHLILMECAILCYIICIIGNIMIWNDIDPINQNFTSITWGFTQFWECIAAIGWAYVMFVSIAEFAGICQAATVVKASIILIFLCFAFLVLSVFVI